MEIIELNSYLDFDKLNIAKDHIIPKLYKEYGMDKLNISITDDAILKIIRDYTREAGVRNLERAIASILRKIAKEIVGKYGPKYAANVNQSISTIPEFQKDIKKVKIIIDPAKVEEHLKAPKYKDSPEKLEDKIGVAMGLA